MAPGNGHQKVEQSFAAVGAHSEPQQCAAGAATVSALTERSSVAEQRVDHVCHRFKSCRSDEADFVTALFYGSKQKLKSRAKHCATQMPGDVRSTHPVPAHFRDK